MLTPFAKIGRHRFAVRRMQSGFAAMLLCLYAAAVWHGTGDHHAHPESACGTCPLTACAADLPEPVAPGHDEESESHACALCTLLHAPATPGLLLAAPAVQLTTEPATPAPTSALDMAWVGSQPSRAPPSFLA